MIRSGGAADGDGEDVDTIDDCLVHAGEYVGGVATVGPADLVGSDASARNHATRGAGGVAEEGGIVDGGAGGDGGGVGAMSVSVARRWKIFRFRDVSAGIGLEVSPGEASSAYEFVVAEGRVEVGCGFTLAAPARGDLRHEGVVEAVRFGAYPCVEDPDDDVMGRLV